MQVVASEPDHKKPWQVKNKIWFQPICLNEFQNKMIKIKNNWVSYQRPSIMSVTGLVNLGTILDVVSDLKP